jgi:undecaprenyl-diphosphatase
MDILIAFVADILVVPIVLVAGWAMLRLPKNIRLPAIFRGTLAGLIALFFAKVASLLYQGERPFVELGVAPKAAYLNNPGFPSDHVLFVVVITLVVWVSTKNKRLGIILAIMSGLVALGRVLALVHTPLDVLGGVICALIGGLLVYGVQLWRTDLPTSKSF